MAVAGVLAQADVGDHHQVGHFALHGTHGELHDAVVGVGARAQLVFRFRDAKEEYRRQAELAHLAALFDQLVHREVEDARHGRDFLAHAFARLDEERID